MTFRACIYAAVSTEEQIGPDKASLDDQLAKTRQACESRGWPIVAEVAVRGHSRSYEWLHRIVTDCPEYARLVSLIEDEQIDLIVAVAHDRLWRTDALRAQLTALCREHRVQIYALAMPQEPDAEPTRSDSRLLVEALSGVMSQLENETRTRRRAVGMAHRIKRGLYNASTIPYGYRRVATDQPIEPAPAQAPWVRWMYERRAEGWGFELVTEGLIERGVPAPAGGIWRMSTVRRILYSPAYRGVAAWGESVNLDAGHEPLVTPALWATVQDINVRRAAHYFGKRRHALSSLCKCGLCGWGMGYTTGSGQNHRHDYIRCNQYAHSRGRECQSNSVRADALEAVVFQAVQAILREPTDWQGPPDSSDELAAVEAQLAEATARWERAYTVYLDGLITRDEFAATRVGLGKTRLTLQRDRDRLAQSAERRVAFRLRLAELSAQADAMAAMSPDELRGLYATLIDRVTVWPDRPPEVVWVT